MAGGKYTWEIPLIVSEITGTSGVIEDMAFSFNHARLFGHYTTMTFEVWAKNDNGSTAYDVKLSYGQVSDPPGSYEVCSVTIPANTTTYTKFTTSSFSNLSASYNYVKFFPWIEDTDISIRSARVLGAVEPANEGNSRILWGLGIAQMGNEETVSCGLNMTGLAYPKYLYYDTSDIENPLSFAEDGYLEGTFVCCWQQPNDKYNLDVAIQRDSPGGSFGTWTTVGYLAQNYNSSEDWIITVGSVSLLSGYNYRIAFQGDNSMATANVGNVWGCLAAADVYNASYFSFAYMGYIYGGTGTSSEATQAQGQTFQVAGACSLYGIKAYARTTGSPTDKIKCEIRSGSFTGTLLATSREYLASQIGYPDKGYGGHIFEFASPPSLSASTTYYMIFERTGSRNTSDYWRVEYQNNNTVYTEGGMAARADNSWGSPDANNDIYFYPIIGPPGKFQIFRHYITEDTTSTGLSGFENTFDPDDYDEEDGTISYYHEHSASGSSSNTKLQKTLDATPTDITNSSITGADRQRSSALSGLPTSADEIDANVVTA